MPCLVDISDSPFMKRNGGTTVLGEKGFEGRTERRGGGAHFCWDVNYWRRMNKKAEQKVYRVAVHPENDAAELP